MKYCKFLIVGFLVFLTFQTIEGQEKLDYINLNYILVKLTFTSRISKSNEEINEKLIKEIRERKVDFVLTDDGEKSIREARGTDLLIKEIRANLPKDVEKKLRQKDEAIKQKLRILDEKSKFFAEAEILYQKFLENRKSVEIDKLTIAIETAKEFINKYGDEKKIKEEYREEFKKDFNEVIDYLKRQIPKLEEKIQSLQF